MRRTPRTLAAPPVTRGLAALALVVLAGGCGDGDDEPSLAPTSTSSASSTTVDAAATTSASSTTTTSGDCATDVLTDGRVSTVGFDDIVFGTTVAAAEADTGVCLEPDRPANTTCYVVTPTGGPAGVSFGVTAGTIERVDIDSGSVTVRSGFGIGSTEAEIVDFFGDGVEVRPRPGGGNDIVFVPADEADAQFRVIFETDGAVVTRFRSGRVPQVEPSAPCPDEEVGA